MSKIPQHLGIIMDGNRRWAKERGLSVSKGHEKGMEMAERIIRHCQKKGVKILTLFTFSTENWQRSKTEVSFLMSLLKKALSKDVRQFAKEGIRLKIIGQREKLPKVIQASFKKAEDLTKKNCGMVLNIALSYGGRAEITSAVRNIIRKKISPEKITEKTISENLWTSDVDLMVRTGKEQRISNFLIWQAAYSELYFCNKYWPDFTEVDLDKALAEFSLRQRTKGR